MLGSIQSSHSALYVRLAQVFASEFCFKLLRSMEFVGLSAVAKGKCVADLKQTRFVARK